MKNIKFIILFFLTISILFKAHAYEGKGEDLGREGPPPAGPYKFCLLYTSPSPRDLSTSRMPSSA